MASGYREVVLSGIHLGQYGSDLQRPFSLERLLGMLLEDDLPGRLRLSSIEPLEITGPLMETIRRSNGFICRHVHVPIQSGSDRILAGMGRPYSRAQMLDALIRLKQEVPGVGIGCDVICGFPGETPEDFILTEEIISGLRIPFVHAFPYSSRPGTRASLLKDDVPPQTKKERVQRLRSLAVRNRTEFADRLVDSSLSVVLESGKNDGSIRWGLADNYIRVKVKGSGGMRAGDLVRVLITDSGEGVLKGKPDGRAKEPAKGGRNPGARSIDNW